MKAILSVGYRHYVVDAADAVRVAEILLGAEQYTTKYRVQEEGGTMHHIWPAEGDGDDLSFPITVISDRKYHLYKLAGPPPKAG